MSNSLFRNQYAPARETSHRESDGNYQSVSFIRGRYRVIICKQGIQWILQVRRSKPHAHARWVAISYHCERDALIRVSRAYFGAPTPIELLELPERVSGVRK